MPLRYWVDRDNGIVRSEGVGVLSMEDLAAYFTATRGDPDVEPGMHRLMNLSAVTQLPSSADIREIAAFARSHPPDPGARMAILADSDVAFGVSMMFKAFVGHGDRLLVVREEQAALDWLIMGRQE